MACSSCGRVGHFGAYTTGSDRQYMTNTGSVISAPNATAGMHAQMTPYTMSGLGGVGDLFNFTPMAGDWVSGVPNGYISSAALLLLVVMIMKG